MNEYKMNGKIGATKMAGIESERSQSGQDHSAGGRLAMVILVFAAIVLVGIASRFWLIGMPNFKPVAALVLFGGFFFRKTWPALVALLLIMVVTDFSLGVYDWTLTAAVYGSLALSCWLGVWVKRSASGSGVGPERIVRFTAASLVMSTAFFLLTNGAVWLSGQWYASTWSGLAECYIAGLPFYRATLSGDLFFTGVVVGAYALGHAWVTRSQRSQDAIVEGVQF